MVWTTLQEQLGEKHVQNCVIRKINLLARGIKEARSHVFSWDYGSSKQKKWKKDNYKEK